MYATDRRLHRTVRVPLVGHRRSTSKCSPFDHSSTVMQKWILSLRKRPSVYHTRRFVIETLGVPAIDASIEHKNVRRAQAPLPKGSFRWVSTHRYQPILASSPSLMFIMQIGASNVKFVEWVDRGGTKLDVFRFRGRTKDGCALR